MPLRNVEDGLTKEEIEGKISSHAEQQNELWGSRMEKISEQLNARLDRHEEKVTERFEKTEEKVDATLEKVNQLVQLVTKSSEQQQGWHKEDLTYRHGVGERLSKQDDAILTVTTTTVEVLTEAKAVRKHQDEMKVKLQLLGWLVMTSKGITNTMRATFTAMETGKKVSHTIAAIMSSILVIWTFFHSMLPIIKAHLHHIH